MGIGVGLGLGLRRIRAGALPASFALGGRDRLCRSSRSSSSSSGGGGGGSSLLVDLGSFRSLGGFGVLAALDSSLSASGVGSRGSSSASRRRSTGLAWRDALEALRLEVLW